MVHLCVSRRVLSPLVKYRRNLQHGAPDAVCDLVGGRGVISGLHRGSVKKTVTSRVPGQLAARHLPNIVNSLSEHHSGIQSRITMAKTRRTLTCSRHVILHPLAMISRLAVQR